MDEPNHLLTNPASVNHQGIPIGKVVKQTSNSVVVRLTETLRLQDGIRIVDEQNSFGFTVTKMMVKGESVREANKGDLVTLFATPVTKSGATVLKTLDRQMGDRTETGKRLVFIDGFAHIARRAFVLNGFRRRIHGGSSGTDSFRKSQQKAID